MSATILITLEEESTGVATMVFTDALGASVVPTSITWSLSTANGTIVNLREDVVIAAPAASVSITLSGLDLAMIDGHTVVRLFTVKAVYSSTEGNNLPLNKEVTFKIRPIKNVA